MIEQIRLEKPYNNEFDVFYKGRKIGCFTKFDDGFFYYSPKDLGFYNQKLLKSICNALEDLNNVT